MLGVSYEKESDITTAVDKWKLFINFQWEIIENTIYNLRKF